MSQSYATSGSDTLATVTEAIRAAVQRLSGQPSNVGAAGRKALKRRDVEKLKTFGFDKFAAVLCYSNQLAR